jgi:DNA gyrase subunit A
MLVTDKGKTIRIPVDGIRVAGRKTQGVTLFSTEPGEHVVSVARLADAGENGDDVDDVGDDITD